MIIFHWQTLMNPPILKSKVRCSWGDGTEVLDTAELWSWEGEISDFLAQPLWMIYVLKLFWLDYSDFFYTTTMNDILFQLASVLFDCFSFLWISTQKSWSILYFKKVSLFIYRLYLTCMSSYINGESCSSLLLSNIGWCYIRCSGNIIGA